MPTTAVNAAMRPLGLRHPQACAADRVHPLDDIVAAHRRRENDEATGNLVVIP